MVGKRHDCKKGHREGEPRHLGGGKRKMAKGQRITNQQDPGRIPRGDDAFPYVEISQHRL